MLNGTETVSCWASRDNKTWHQELRIHPQNFSFRRYYQIPGSLADVDIKALAEQKVCETEDSIQVDQNASGKLPSLSTGLLVCMYGNFHADIQAQSWTYAHLVSKGVELAVMDPSEALQTIKGIHDETGKGVKAKPGLTIIMTDESKEIVPIMESARELGSHLVQAQEEAAVTWWKEKTGRNVRAACFSMRMRYTGGGTLGGLPVMHIDASRFDEWAGIYSRKRTHDLLGMTGIEAMRHVVLQFNKWVNAGQDFIEQLPLMLLDTTTLTKEDVDIAWIQAGLDSKGVRWSDKFKWYYTNIQRGEGYIWATVPHQGKNHTDHPGIALGTPHGAFSPIRSKAAGTPKPRTSFEFRCMLVDPDFNSTEVGNSENLSLHEKSSEEVVQMESASLIGQITKRADIDIESVIQSVM